MNYGKENNLNEYDNRGWIKIYRHIIDSDIYLMPPLYLRVFERLLLEANHKDNFIPYKDKNTNIISKKLIKRGERLTSVRDICKWVAWYERGKLKEPNPKTIQNIMDWLENNNMINIYGVKGNRKETHYNIVNYNVYQAKDNDKVTEKKQSMETNKNDKEKDIPLKKESKNFSNDDKEYKLSKYLSKCIAERLDKPLKDEKTLQSWAKEFNKMVRLDKYDFDEMLEVLQFSQTDEFWKKNILSAAKFRKQYLTLLAQMRG